MGGTRLTHDAMKSDEFTSVTAPDLDDVRRFMLDMIGRGAVTEMVAAIISLLARMRDLNTELMSKLASKSRNRPPNESLRRLAMEMPLVVPPVANNAKPGGAPDPLKPKKKRGPKRRHRHGRPKLPDSLPRIADLHLVPREQRMCPNCKVEARTIGFKINEKLDIEPARFIVNQEKYETVACQLCHEYICTCSKKDEVLDRGILGNELLVQALVDHYDDAVPWERMQRNARQQGVPLSAQTLAASVGRVVDHTRSGHPTHS